MQPSGSLLGSWQRSNWMVWTRLGIWLVALAISTLYTMIAGFLPLIFAVVFLVLFVLDVRRLVLNLDRIFELYSDGLVVKNQFERELYAYRWNEIVDINWPVYRETRSHTRNSSGSNDLLSIIFMMVIEVIMSLIFAAVGHSINKSRAKYTLWLRANDRRLINVGISYNDSHEMVELVRKTALAAWVKDMNSQLKHGKSIVLDMRLTLTPEGIQIANQTIKWNDITSIEMGTQEDEVVILSSDQDGKDRTYNFACGLKALALKTLFSEAKSQTEIKQQVVSASPAFGI